MRFIGLSVVVLAAAVVGQPIALEAYQRREDAKLATRCWNVKTVQSVRDMVYAHLLSVLDETKHASPVNAKASREDIDRALHVNVEAEAVGVTKIDAASMSVQCMAGTATTFGNTSDFDVVTFTVQQTGQGFTPVIELRQLERTLSVLQGATKPIAVRALTQ